MTAARQRPTFFHIEYENRSLGYEMKLMYNIVHWMLLILDDKALHKHGDNVGMLHDDYALYNF